MTDVTYCYLVPKQSRRYLNLKEKIIKFFFNFFNFSMK